MAENRLCYPAELSDFRREQYETYIRAHDIGIAVSRAKQRKLESLHFLCRQNLLSGGAITEAVLTCAGMGWATGAAELMQYKREAENAGKKRYEFEEFA